MDFMTLESWGAKLGYVVELHGSVFHVHKELEISGFKCNSRSEVVEFILGEIRKSCCGDP